MLNGLKDIGRRYPNQVANVRGRGTFCAFDCPTMAKRDELVEILKTEGISLKLVQIRFSFNFFFLTLGVQTGGAGPVAVRLRPSLVFQPHHAAIFLDKLDNSLKKMDKKL